MNPIFNVTESPWSDPGPGEWVPDYMRPEAWGRQPANPAVPPQQQQQMPMPMPNFQGLFPMFPPLIPMFPPGLPVFSPGVPMFPFPQQQRRREQQRQRQQQWPDALPSSSSGSSSGSSSPPSPAAVSPRSAAASGIAGPGSAAASSPRAAERPASWTSLPQGSRPGGSVSSAARRGGSVVGSVVGSIAPGESALSELNASLVEGGRAGGGSRAEGGSRAGSSQAPPTSRASRNARTVVSGATFGPGPLGFQMRSQMQTRGLGYPWAGGW